MWRISGIRVNLIGLPGNLYRRVSSWIVLTQVSFLAIIQAVWFSINCFGRAASHLFITTLELTTLSFIIIFLITSYCWYHKPKGRLSRHCPRHHNAHQGYTCPIPPPSRPGMVPDPPRLSISQRMVRQSSLAVLRPDSALPPHSNLPSSSLSAV